MFRKILTPLIVLYMSLLGPAGNRASAQSPTTPFVTTDVADTQAIITATTGDLWPSCWADDDNLNATNGDGKGFNLKEPGRDISVNLIAAPPARLTAFPLPK